MYLAALLIAVALRGLDATPPIPVPNPARPHPYFSWDTIPLAFHGANRTGLYNEEAMQILAKYQMVTIEKWYTKCASSHPNQGPPSCAVEDKMFGTFNDLRARNPKATFIMYLNSMMDFDFYRLNGIIQAREAKGEKLLLRDENGVVVDLCNDGNYYCGVHFFDWSNEAMRELWTSHLLNATQVGNVSGVFADHASQMLLPTDKPQLCNGAGDKRRCFSFTPQFAADFNAGHHWLINHTQDVLSKLPGGGPVVDGPYARYNVNPCDFDSLKRAVDAGQAGDGPFVIEANREGGCSAGGSPSCLAAYLVLAQKYTYLSCLSDSPPWYPAYGYALGSPVSDAVEGPPGVWARNFSSTTGITTAIYDTKRKTGSVHWAGQPPPPPPSPPLPPSCGKVMLNTATANDDVFVTKTTSAGACCDACKQHSACTIWCWHEEAKHALECHLHNASATIRPDVAGRTTGVMPARAPVV